MTVIRAGKFKGMELEPLKKDGRAILLNVKAARAHLDFPHVGTQSLPGLAAIFTISFQK